MPRYAVPIKNSELRQQIAVYQRRIRAARWRRERYTPTSTRRCKPRGSRCPERLGELLLLLAQRLATRPNFHGYSYDLVADAMPVLIRACQSFDLSRKTSAFGFLTTCCWRSFTSTIQREHRRGFRSLPDGERPELLAMPSHALGEFGSDSVSPERLMGLCEGS